MSEVVLVTGGASGIGAAVARRFAQAGAKVVIADVNPAGADVAGEIGGLFVPTDVASAQDNEAMVAAAVDAFGRLDVVHLNAGTGNGGVEFDLESYRRIMAVNADGTMYGMRAAVRGGARAIVVTSSLAGIAPASFDPAYSASKHAVIGLVRSFAAALPDVTVNAVCPGFVDTPMVAAFRERLVEHGLAVAAPDEVAAAVEAIVRGGETGGVWAVQGGQAPELVTFPAVELAR
ncbi:SDR family NAD(P)-dependent oxidoreductase [Kutzneria buriramensis]|uniref:NAD(P)-dependent dehydrogenase (Short-subunit alcohol dehydrogenase family) n=1 Tax=Kutzneria buriramensis TaxID=1045776 RepID=A0A3E0HP32_9PSEU|nr:SDR family NAD(P)-dependent oxidoreductase [Kutzneria buriramensis]REH48157.1 NAD(P)-dependent dehydrogenase (short-subunit alcohol dehydrogenase family) [Kutzneria buriramensis]